MKENAEYQKSLLDIIELLQIFHDGLGMAGEPKGLCSYCGKSFTSPLQAKEHVLTCEANPFIAEVAELKATIEEQAKVRTE